MFRVRFIFKKGNSENFKDIFVGERDKVFTLPDLFEQIMSGNLYFLTENITKHPRDRKSPKKRSADETPEKYTPAQAYARQQYNSFVRDLSSRFNSLRRETNSTLTVIMRYPNKDKHIKRNRIKDIEKKFEDMEKLIVDAVGNVSDVEESADKESDGQDGNSQNGDGGDDDSESSENDERSSKRASGKSKKVRRTSPADNNEKSGKRSRKEKKKETVNSEEESKKKKSKQRKSRNNRS